MCDIGDKGNSIEKHCKKLSAWQNVFSILSFTDSDLLVHSLYTSRLYKSKIYFYFPQFRQFYLKQSKLHNIFNLAKEDICGLCSVNCINYVQLGQNNICKRKHRLKEKKGREIELTLISNEIRKRKICIKEQESLLGSKFIRPVLLLTSRDSLPRFI